MDHIPYTTPADERMFSSIGRLVVAWSGAETAIDFLVLFLHHNVGGRTIEREMPWALSRKVRYLRKCFNKLTPLAPHRDHALPLLDEVTALSEMRQDIIHGYVADHAEGSDQIKIVRILRGGEFYGYRPISVTAVTIMESAADAMDLGTRLLRFATTIGEKFPFDQTDQSLS